VLGLGLGLEYRGVEYSARVRVRHKIPCLSQGMRLAVAASRIIWKRMGRTRPVAVGNNYQTDADRPNCTLAIAVCLTCCRC
jgi:hypothetical protein